MILPDDLNMVYRSSSCLNCAKCKHEKCAEIPNADNNNSIQDAYVKIVDGNLVCGTIDKKSIGAMAGVILQRIIRTHGLERGRQFVDDVTKLAIRGIMYDGYSFGIDDEDLTKNEYGMIGEALDKAEDDVERLIRSYEAGTLEPLPGRTLEETLEMNTMQVLGKARDSTGKIAGGHLGLSNSAVVMAVSGARGRCLT